MRTKRIIITAAAGAVLITALVAGTGAPIRRSVSTRGVWTITTRRTLGGRIVAIHEVNHLGDRITRHVDADGRDHGIWRMETDSCAGPIERCYWHGEQITRVEWDLLNQ